MFIKIIIFAMFINYNSTVVTVSMGLLLDLKFYVASIEWEEQYNFMWQTSGVIQIVECTSAVILNISTVETLLVQLN